MSPSKIRLPGWRKLAPALAVAALLSGCVSELERARAGHVSGPTLARIEKAGMDRRAPILVRVFKESSELEIWKQDRSGQYALLKTYPVCHYSGTLGPKKAEGDYQAPEGFYAIRLGQMNPHSIEYLSFNVGYPNSFDRSLGRTGSSLMVHGGCRSVGCYAMSDDQIDEIYALAFEAFEGGQRDIQLQAYPFRMTDQNLAAHAADPNLPFWQMLKTGSDLFERNAYPPHVEGCNGRYVFSPDDGRTPPAAESCPAAI